MAQPSANPGDLRVAISELDWYHTMELAPGLITPGWLDTREVAARVPLPATLAGCRCLDVATFNGFWAFEMERRGAEEVVAIDVLDPQRWDWPAASADEARSAIGARHAGGRGFEIAARELCSSVRRAERSVYDLDPSEDGSFDVVYLGSLLVHLRDPVRALERIRSVCRGTLVVVDGIDLALSTLLARSPVARFDGRGRPWWWLPNAAGLARMVEAGGFDLVQGPDRLYIPPGPGQALSRRPRPRALATRAGREALVSAWRGDPHAALVARPRV